MRTVFVYGALLALLLVIGRTWLSPASPEAPTPTGPGTTSVLGVVALLAACLGGIGLVADSRDEIHRPARNLLPALLLPLVLLGGFGTLAAVTVAHVSVAGLPPGDLAPLVTLASLMAFSNRALLEIVFLLAGLLINLIALERTLVGGLRLMGAMVRDGYLPEALQTLDPNLGTPLRALLLLAGASAALTTLGPDPVLVGLAALAFLWTAALVNAPDVIRPRARLTKKRPLKLPFHPLIPGLATAVGLFLPLALPGLTLLAGVAWVLLGGLAYVGYARRGSIAARRKEFVVSEAAVEGVERDYTVVVGIANPATAQSLIRLGAKLARAHGGRLLAVQVVILPEQVPAHLKRQAARSQWEVLDTLVRRAGVDGLPVEPLVRLAHTPVEGLLDTAREEAADALLLGWAGPQGPGAGAADLDPVLDPLIRAAPCDVAILRGQVTGPARSILVPTAGGPHAQAALQLAADLAAAEEGRVIALNVVRGSPSRATEDQARERLEMILAGLPNGSGIEPRVVHAADVEEGILREAAGCDLLLLGASREGVLSQTFFGGFPVEVASHSPRPTILVKHYEGARRFWLRRMWEAMSAPFPTLTVTERAEVYQRMRHAARPTVDFFVLIVLAATIAGLGLLQNSPAVIIGAMLVAPLMSPILSMAMSIVQGNLRLLRLGAESTTKGIFVAISVGIAVTLISPLRAPTNEILARTQPTLLDLVVALASGAAAGYALSRKELSAALPGVAIAAALVPPLCVVGYGTATAQLRIAGGALLLFNTNLSAIVLAAAVVFLLLGFRPQRAERRQQLRRGLVVSILSLLLISIPLGFVSSASVRQIDRQQRVEAVLDEEISGEFAQVADVAIERQGQGFVINATVYAFAELDPEKIGAIQRRLIAEVGAPVTLRATVLRATRTEAGANLAPTPTPGP